MWIHKRPQNDKSNPKKEKWSWKIRLPDFRLNYKATVIKQISKILVMVQCTGTVHTGSSFCSIVLPSWGILLPFYFIQCLQALGRDMQFCTGFLIWQQEPLLRVLELDFPHRAHLQALRQAGKPKAVPRPESSVPTGNEVERRPELWLPLARFSWQASLAA